jgi:hypothetical protein
MSRENALTALFFILVLLLGTAVLWLIWVMLAFIVDHIVEVLIGVVVICAIFGAYLWWKRKSIFQ